MPKKKDRISEYLNEQQKEENQCIFSCLYRIFKENKQNYWRNIKYLRGILFNTCFICPSLKELHNEWGKDQKNIAKEKNTSYSFLSRGKPY